MTIAIEQAARRDTTTDTGGSADAAAMMQEALARAQGSASRTRPAVVATPHATTPPDTDAHDFLRDHRIHIKHGSLFVDPYLVLHPRELAPEHEAKLREKLHLTYTVNNPSFYESYDRLMVALNLGQLVPVSLATRESRLLDEHRKLQAQKEKGGADDALQRHLTDRLNPFAAIVRDTIEKPSRDPVGIETLKNGLALYLLVREKLTLQGYRGKLTDYVVRSGTLDQVLSELSEKIGITTLGIREAAMKGGIDGVGKLLGIDPAYVADVKKLSDYAATQDFGFNLIEHWHLGRQLHGIHMPMMEKIAHGLEARITAKIEEFRSRARHTYDVPAPVKAEEKRIAESLNLLEPVQRALMHKLGYEICFSPEYLADDIAMYRGVYGLHRKAASDLKDIRGTYRIYFSGHGDLKGSMRTMVHEVAHNLWPEQFTPEAVQTIDALALSDARRFGAFKKLLDEKFPEFEKFLRAYQAGSDAEKAAIVQTTKAYFSGYGVSIDEGLLPYLRDANEFRYLVAYAHDTLTTEGARYARSGYDSPQERFREVLSRFAEIKQVELSGNPQLVQYLAPGLNQVWETQYIPHLERVYHQIEASEALTGEAIAKAKRTSASGKQTAHAETPAEAAATPKVENRPGNPTPTAPTGKDGAQGDSAACLADPLPRPTVDAASIHPSMVSALSTLQQMGVAAGR
jgi:hypothetical protein